MQTDCSSIQREHLLKAPRALILNFKGWRQWGRPAVRWKPWACQQLQVFFSASSTFFGLATILALGPCKYLETTGWPCWWRTWRRGASTRWRRSTTPRPRSPRSLYKIPSGRNLSELQQISWNIWYKSGMPLQLAHSTLMALVLPQPGCGVKPTEICRRFVSSFLL